MAQQAGHGVPAFGYPGNYGAGVHTATNKVPPSWAPEMQATYPFQDWVDDVKLWIGATEVNWQQQGPVVALQLGGLAREIARQVPQQDLTQGFVQDFGDGQGQVWHSGVELLLFGLARKFGALTVETAISDMTALVAFRRRAGEQVDEALARWDLLKHKAEVRGGFILQPAQAAWMILNALGIPSNQWAQFLAPNLGNLPATGAELTALTSFIRRQGHLYENQGLARAAGQAPKVAANYAAGTEPCEQVYGTWGADPAVFPNTTTRETGSQAASSASVWWTWDGQNPEQWDQSYLYEPDDNSTDTSEGEPSDYSYMTFTITPESTDADVVQAYNAIKARWRAQVGKYPRRYRKGKGKGKGRFSHRNKGKPNWSFHGNEQQHPQQDYYGGKGKKGDRRKNPRGKNGEPLRCDCCGSDEHLWRKCTAPGADEFRKKRQAGQDGGKAFFGGPGAAATPSPAAASTATSSSAPGPATSALGRWQQLTGQQPPTQRQERHVHFLVTSFDGEEEGAAVPTEERETEQFGIWEEPEEENQQEKDDLDEWYQTPVAPMSVSEEESLRPFAEVEQEVLQQIKEHGERLRLAGAQDEQERDQERLRWFMGPAFPRREKDTREVYLKSTRLDGPGEALLIDLGAYDNLTGDEWAKRAGQVAEQAGENVKTEELSTSIGVEGVGSGAQRATELLKLPGAFKTSDGRRHRVIFEAPIIPNSDVPALWGHKSLARNRAVIDTVNRKIYLCGEGNIKFTPPPGTLTCDMILSTSGHLLLPISEFDKARSKDMRQNRELRLSFTSREQSEEGKPTSPAVSPQ